MEFTDFKIIKEMEENEKDKEIKEIIELKEKYESFIYKNSKKGRMPRNSYNKKEIFNRKYFKVFQNDLNYNFKYMFTLDSIEEENEEDIISIDLKKKTLKKLLRNYNVVDEVKEIITSQGISTNIKKEYKKKKEEKTKTPPEEILRAYKFYSYIVEKYKEKNTENMENCYEKMVEEYNLGEWKGRKMSGNSKNSMISNKSKKEKQKEKEDKSKNNDFFNENESQKELEENKEEQKIEKKQNSLEEVIISLDEFKYKKISEINLTNEELSKIFNKFKADFGGKNESMKFEIEQVLKDINNSFTPNQVIYKRYCKYVRRKIIFPFLIYLIPFNCNYFPFHRFNLL